MGLSILSVGTAVPESRVTQAESAKIARIVAGLGEEPEDFLPSLYRQTPIAARHLAFEPQVVHDFLHGTRDSGSVFLPRGDGMHPGPTTEQRMKHYMEKAGPLAVRAARLAVAKSGLARADFTHLVPVSCTGFRAPGVHVDLIQERPLPATIDLTHVGLVGWRGAFNGMR